MGAAPHGRRLGAGAALKAGERWHGEVTAHCVARYGAAARGGGGGGIPWRRGHGVEAASARRDCKGEGGEGNGESGFRILTNFG